MEHSTFFNRHKPRLQLLFGAVALAALAGCTNWPSSGQQAAGPPPPSTAPPIPAKNKVAMVNGERIVANTAEGKMTISAGPGLLRVFRWDGNIRWAVMKPREKAWAGSIGIHYQGTPPDWTPVEGLSRIKFEEGQRHFENVDDALIWLQIRRLHFVHTSNGLVVGWRRLIASNTLQVEVWQFYIGGKKPVSLPGAKNYSIQIEHTRLRASNAS